MKAKVDTALDAVLAICFAAVVATMILKAIHP